jgi:hypothetical protein
MGDEKLKRNVQQGRQPAPRAEVDVKPFSIQLFKITDFSGP